TRFSRDWSSDVCSSDLDRRAGARLGVYDRRVADMLTPYLRPQEAGNRTGVRWAEVTDAQGVGLRFEGEPTMEFSALSWTPAEIRSEERRVGEGGRAVRS